MESRRSFKGFSPVVYLPHRGHEYLVCIREKTWMHDKNETERCFSIYRSDAAQIIHLGAAKRIVKALRQEGESWGITRYDKLTLAQSEIDMEGI